jgi:hypothetical protein
MTTTRRHFLSAAVPAAGAVAAPDLARAGQTHDLDHQVVPSDPALRVKALESLLVEKGLVDPAALDGLVDAYEHKPWTQKRSACGRPSLGRSRL